MDTELQKRKNPFDVKKPTVIEQEPVIEEEENKYEDNYNEEPVKQPVQRPVYTERAPQRNQKVQKTTKYVEPEEVAREKYTSTMEIELRRTIKILCATRGIMFAQFIEDACREKLKREGVI